MDELDDALMDIMNDFTADGNDIRKLLVNPKFHNCKLHWSEPTPGSMGACTIALASTSRRLEQVLQSTKDIFLNDFSKATVVAFMDFVNKFPLSQT